MQILKIFRPWCSSSLAVPDAQILHTLDNIMTLVWHQQYMKASLLPVDG